MSSLPQEIPTSIIRFEQDPSGFYRPVSGEPEPVHDICPREITLPDITKSLLEANQNYAVIRGEDRRPYEVSIINPGNERTVLMPSTSFSSLRKNPGNAWEFAVAGAADTTTTFIYVGSFGNGPTGRLATSDLWYFARHGRYTRGDGSAKDPYRALHSVQDLANTLVNNSLQPTHLTANAEAGRLALGLMAALPTNSIRGAYLNGLDGISSSANRLTNQLSEDLTSRLQRRQAERAGTNRTQDITPRSINLAKLSMPNVYHGKAKILHQAPLTLFLTPIDTLHWMASSLGLIGHNDLELLRDHGVYQDMQAALRNQRASMVIQQNLGSKIHDMGATIAFGQATMNGLPFQSRTPDRNVKLLFGEGSLDQHTLNPEVRAAIEQAVFDRGNAFRISMQGLQNVIKPQPAREYAISR